MCAGLWNVEGRIRDEFENIWNHNARHKTCGFFIPQVWSMEPYIEDGNSLIMDAWKYDRDDKAEQRHYQKAEDYIIYVAQRANSPADAFIDTKDNLFTSPILNTHVQWLYDSDEAHYYSDGWYVSDQNNRVKFLSKNQCEEQGIKLHPYINEVPFTSDTDIHGCVREYFSPFKTREGITPENLYFITVDTYRIDKDKEQVNIKNSLYSIQCWMRTNPYTPYEGKRLVAEYCGRLDTMAENDRIALNMAIRYNCGILPEAGTGEIVSNFKVWGFRDKLMYDPTAFVDRSLKLPNAQIGVVIGDGEKKLEGLRLLRDFIYEVVGKTEKGDNVYRLNQIHSLAFSLELQRYSLNGNYDRVSSAIVAMFEFKKDFILRKDDMEPFNRIIPATLKERLKRKSLHK